MPEMPIVAFDDDNDHFTKFAGVRSAIELERQKAIRMQTERRERIALVISPDQDRPWLDDPSYNYWAGQVAMADMALSYFDMAERDL